jgi:2,5-diamino-6-(ribosylamino)-4(3H)-pyrimidinone 5'-phosphate reductase
MKFTEKLFIVTTNKAHPALDTKSDKLEVIAHNGTVDFVDLFEKLGQKGAKAMTIQSGGEMNSVLLRAGLIDKVSIVVAPVLVGGRDTASLVDGESLKTVKDLQKLRALELQEAEQLENSYLHLTYTVRNS